MHHAPSVLSVGAPSPRTTSRASEPAFAVPHFVLQEAQARSAASGIVDASDLLGSNDGLRATNDVHQLALNEHRSTRASGHVWRVIEALRPGISELELSVHMGLTGLPLAAHVMLATGKDRVNGLYSPSDRVIGRGDRLSTAVGLHGGLASRAGIVAEIGDGELSEEQREFVRGYWAAVATWDQSLAIGASTGDIAEKVTKVLATANIEPLLNPGHLQHVDEWLDSPFTIGDDHRIHSGMSLQGGHHPCRFTRRIVRQCRGRPRHCRRIAPR